MPRPSPATPASLSSVTWAGTTNWRGKEVATWELGSSVLVANFQSVFNSHLPGFVCPRHSDTLGLGLPDHLLPICVPKVLPSSPSSSNLQLHIHFHFLTLHDGNSKPLSFYNIHIMFSLTPFLSEEVVSRSKANNSSLFFGLVDKKTLRHLFSFEEFFIFFGLLDKESLRNLFSLDCSTNNI